MHGFSSRSAQLYPSCLGRLVPGNAEKGWLVRLGCHAGGLLADSSPAATILVCLRTEGGLALVNEAAPKDTGAKRLQTLIVQLAGEMTAP